MRKLQIPCRRCSYYHAKEKLKCSFHPEKAGTDKAIRCPDFDPKGS